MGTKKLTSVGESASTVTEASTVMVIEASTVIEDGGWKVVEYKRKNTKKQQISN